jgi:hypothetical protein
MNRKKIGAALIALSFPVIALSISVGSANAATVSSTVTAMDACAWQAAGFPETITLGSEDKYVGEDLEVTSEAPDTITLGLSGQENVLTASEGTSIECTFYNDKASAQVDVEMDGTSVDAFYDFNGTQTRDEDLSFTVGEGSPFTINTVSTCDAAFSVIPNEFDLIGGPASTLISIASSTLTNEYAEGDAPRCAIASSYSLTIPEITGVPAAPGADYTFSGGSVSFVIDSTRDSELLPQD